MEHIKKNFGFGFMRLPMIGDEVDYAQTCRMVDAFMEACANLPYGGCVYGGWFQLF